MAWIAHRDGRELSPRKQRSDFPYGIDVRFRDEDVGDLAAYPEHLSTFKTVYTSFRVN